MKKLLLIFMLLISITLSACETEEPRIPVTELEIFGTRDKISVAGEEVSLLRNIKVKNDKDEDLIPILEITSEQCDIIDGVLNSEVVVDCDVKYYVSIDGIEDEVNITVSFRPAYRELDVIEEHNNIRMYQIYVAAYQDGIEGGYGFGYGPSDHNGDLQGVINSLDYIASLNVNAIWLTPIFESKDHSSLDEYEKRGRPTGYFADDYYTIDPNFGTNDLFQTLVDEAHARGLYVILDGVFGHHGYYDIEGVVDGKAQWYGHETVYPESLDYYTNVAIYWIEEYGIDGWRLDQAYQLYQDNYNYFREIRNAVEDVSAERKANGEEWGTLGYFVAEVFDITSNIKKYAYNNNAFRSAFNFPLRSTLVGALAINDFNQTATLREVDFVMNTVLPDYAQPNLFITNHDVVRLGDLLQIAGLEHQYYERHKLAISFLAAYTGPITLYYGDEYGDEFEGLTTSIASNLSQYLYIAQDNVARSNGQIDNFDSEQEDLIAYTSTVMNIRDTYDSLWNGERENLYVDDIVYVDLKTSENNQILYAFTISDMNQTITLDATLIIGTQVRNLITNEIFTILDGEITITLEALSAGFFLIE